MVSIGRQNAIDSLAVSAIDVYQRYLSPHKGFVCAYRVLHNSESCSQYVKIAVARYGLIEALQLSKQRFADCKAAYETLQAQRDNKKDSRRSNSQNDECCCLTWVEGLGDCSDLMDCCSPEHCSDWGNCDAGDCDLGNCEVSGCDTCSCDFGSCSSN